MKYVSTRGLCDPASFRDVTLTGLAPDGGLYVPENLPALDLRALKGLSYVDTAFALIHPFVGSDIPSSDLRKIIHAAYAHFRDPLIAPLRKISEHHYLLELFHGPTLAFKDFALQFLGQVLEYFLGTSDEKLTLLCATSGDTGSAAIAGVRNLRHVQLFVLYPHNRISDVQRRQMTTVAASNIHTLAVEGSFDDCQSLVKDLFADRELGPLSGVNSINWARILPQIVYYVYASLQFDTPVSFSVPTGNFGNIYAAYIARKMGAPIDKLILATNSNDILHRYFETGHMKITPVQKTLAPSMDITVSSNFERLLYDLCGGNTSGVRSQMEALKSRGEFYFDPRELISIFQSQAIDDDQILNQIKQTFDETGILIDPHTACGVKAARTRHTRPQPVISLACAHPAKFPEATKKAVDVSAPLPDFLKDLPTLPEKIQIIPADYEAVKRLIQGIK